MFLVKGSLIKLRKPMTHKLKLEVKGKHLEIMKQLKTKQKLIY